MEDTAFKGCRPWLWTQPHLLHISMASIIFKTHCQLPRPLPPSPWLAGRLPQATICRSFQTYVVQMQKEAEEGEKRKKPPHVFPRTCPPFFCTFFALQRIWRFNKTEKKKNSSRPLTPPLHHPLLLSHLLIGAPHHLSHPPPTTQLDSKAYFFLALS